MSRVHGPQPLGWTPPDSEDCQHVDSLGTQSERNRSFSPLSHSDTNRNFSLTTGHNPSHHHHEPGRVGRPRNKFIIFRCEYSQIHCRKDPHVRRPPGTSKGPTLSRRASEAWKQMSNEEKEPYKIRAEEERIDHARKYPGYRFRPQRRSSSSARSCNPRPGTNVTFPYPGITDDPSTPFTSYGYTVSHSSTSMGSLPDPSLKKRSVSVSGWTPPLAYHASGVELGFVEPAVKQPSAGVPKLNHRNVNTPAVPSGWNDLLVSTPTVKSVQPNMGHIQSASTSSVADFAHYEYPSTQHQPYPNSDTAWSFPVPPSAQMPNANVINSHDVVTTPLQPITISNYTTLADAILN